MAELQADVEDMKELMREQITNLLCQMDGLRMAEGNRHEGGV